MSAKLYDVASKYSGVILATNCTRQEAENLVVNHTRSGYQTKIVPHVELLPFDLSSDYDDD